MSLPKPNRILRRAEFRRIYEGGTRMTSRYFAVFCLRNEQAVAGQIAVGRFGFTTPRALGKAVKRNFLKRRFREAVRSHLDAAPNGWDLVFNPRQAAADAPFDDLCREVGRILERCK